MGFSKTGCANSLSVPIDYAALRNLNASRGDIPDLPDEDASAESEEEPEDRDTK